MAKIQIKNSFITSSADITISSSLVRFSGGISAKNITGSFSGSIPQLSSYFKQAGNSFGTTATLGTNDNQALIFETNGSTRMYISGSGNVGIGTTSPTANLTVYNSSTPTIDFNTGASTSRGRISATSSDLTIAALTSSPLIFKIDTSEKARIEAGGNVGIGTSSPARKLHVYVTTGPVMRLQTSGSNASIEFAPSLGTSNNRYNWLIGAQQNISDAFEITPSTAANGSTFSTPAILVASSGNIGIGTTSPTQRLDLSGSLRIRSAGTYSDPTDNAGFINYDSTGGIFTLSARSNGGNTYMAFRTSNAGAAGERMRIINDGNVGIGTTSPAVNLHVVSSGTTIIKTKGGTDNNEGSAFYVEQAGSTNTLTAYGDASAITGGTPDQNVSIWTAGSIPLLFYIGGGERMRITSAGNVGIGTTAPGAKLDVNGDVYVSPNTAGKNTFIFSTNASNDARLLMRSDVTTKVDIQANGASYFNGGNVGIGTTSPSGKLDIAVSSTMGTYGPGTTNLNLRNTNTSETNSGAVEFIGYSGNATSPYRWATILAEKQTSAGDGDYGGKLYLWVTSGGANGETNSGAYRRLTIDSSGNVGIGTTSPLAKLHVTGSSTIPAAVLIGNVGIGTTSPTYKLNVVTTAVSGRQTLTNIDKTAQNLITFTNPQYSVLSSMGLMLRVYPQSDSRQGAGILASGGAFNGDTDLDLFVSSGSAASTTFSALKINARGSVGIGTTSPGNNLVVYNGAGWAGTDLNGTSGGELIFRTSGTLKANIYASTSTGFVLNGASETIFQIGSSEKMRIINDGNIGIGTSSPSKNLHIRSTVAGDTGIIIENTNNAQNLDIDYWNNVGSIVGRIRYSEATGDFSFYPNTAASEALTIKYGGNVGIGTTAPAYKLDVSGSISADAFLGKSFGMTGASGSTAIYDAYLSNGQGEVYELIAAGSPNAGGSSGYRDVLYGKIIIGTGYNGSAVTTYINYVQENPDPRSLYNSGLGTSLSASICFKSGSSEVTNKPAGQSTKIRVKIGSYISNAYAGYTTVRVKRLF